MKLNKKLKATKVTPSKSRGPLSRKGLFLDAYHQVKEIKESLYQIGSEGFVSTIRCPSRIT